MIGVPIDGSALMLGGNKSVVINTTIPSSALKKKHNAIAYHHVLEAIAARLIRFCHIDSKINVADVLTKPLDNQSFHHLIRPFLFRNPGEPRWPPENKVLSVFDPLAKDPSVQTPSASVSEQPSTSGEVNTPNSTGGLPKNPSTSSFNRYEIRNANYLPVKR